MSASSSACFAALRRGDKGASTLFGSNSFVFATGACQPRRRRGESGASPLEASGATGAPEGDLTLTSGIGDVIWASLDLESALEASPSLRLRPGTLADEGASFWAD